MKIQEKGINYWIENNEAMILGFDVQSKVLLIPELINNVPITKISKYAFSHMDLIEAYLPNSIYDIGQGAFSDCHELKVVSFYNTSNNTNNKLRIRNQVFWNCSSLEKIYAPFMYVHIDSYGLAHCESLVEINALITALKGISLVGCDSLVYLIFANNATIEDVSIYDLRFLKQLSFKGDAEIHPLVLQKIQEKGITIVCNSNSSLTDLTYLGFSVNMYDV